MSPVLFTVFMDDIIRESRLNTKDLYVGFRNMQRVGIGECAYADDIMIVAENERDLQRNLDIWNRTLAENGMMINKDKTKVMALTKTPRKMHIQLDSAKIEQVKYFNYLGVIIEETGNQEAEITSRIDKTVKLYYSMNKAFINRKEISRQTKISVYKAIYRPVLTYGCESWVLTKNQKSKIQAIEMRYLRRTKGITRKDRIRNQQVREELGVTKSVLEFIEQRQLSWWGHLQRLDSKRPVKQIWEAKPDQKRGRGRPKETWDSAVGKILKKKGKTWQEAKVLAREKKEWRKFVYN